MDGKEDNLGKYVREKLSDFTNEADGWDRPDASVWENAQPGINAGAATVAGAGSAAKVWLISLLTVGVLASGFYIYSLQTQVHELEEQLKQKDSELIDSENRVANFQEKLNTRDSQEELFHDIQSGSRIKMEELQAVNEELYKTNSLLISENKQLKQTKQENTWTISPHQKPLLNPISGSVKGHSLESNLKNVSVFTSDGAGANAWKGIPDVITSLNLSPQFATVNTQKPVFEIPGISKLRNRFQIGYEYSLLSFTIPVRKEFQNQRIVSNDVQTEEVNAHSNGIFFAFTPKRNWWIRTGFKHTPLQFDRNSNVSLAYNRDGEYTRQDRRRGNDLYFGTRTPYSQAKSVISIAIPDGTDLESGDLLEVSLNESLQFTYYQVPLGLEYHLGGQRLQLVLEGGAQWNQIVFNNYTQKTTVSLRGDEIPVARQRVFSREIPTKYFMSGYAGLGLDYRIYGRWFLRGTLSYNHNFINDGSARFFSSGKANRVWKIGLNYQL